jgi:hypothetical protein
MADHQPPAGTPLTPPNPSTTPKTKQAGQVFVGS